MEEETNMEEEAKTEEVEKTEEDDEPWLWQAPALQWQAPPFCEIMDLQEIYYDQVLRLIKYHYFKEEPMCKSSELLRSRKSTNQYLDLIKTWMDDGTSLVVISKSTGRVIGTLIARINSLLDKTNTYSRVQISESKTLEKIMNLKSTLILQADAYNIFQVDEYYRIYILCVHPSYKNKNLETELLYTAYEVAKTLKLSAIGGIFTSEKIQTAASKAGFQIVSEIKYSEWLADEEIVFDDPGTGNYSAAFMGTLTPNEDSQNEISKSRRRAWKEEEYIKCIKSKTSCKQ